MTHNSNFIITFNKFPNTFERVFKHSLNNTAYIEVKYTFFHCIDC